MALLYFDGFAHQNTSRYTSATISVWNTSNGRITNYSVSPSDLQKSVGVVSDGVVGMGVIYNFQGTARWSVQFYGDTNTTQHITVMNNSSGHIEVRRGGTGGTLLATGATVLAINSWFYLEIRVVISDTVGVVQVRLNGSTSNEINLTGADTKNAGTNSSWDAVRLVGDGTDKYSDLYILDSTGARNNTFLGDVVVRQLVPTADGDLSGLTGSDGNQVANWQQVDELPPSAADYNGSPTVTAEDAYNITDLPTNATAVYGVRVNANMLKSDAGAASGQVVARIAGTDYTTTARSLGTTVAEFTDVYESSPATSAAWTVSEVNGLQIGMKVA